MPIGVATLRRFPGIAIRKKFAWAIHPLGVGLLPQPVRMMVSPFELRLGAAFQSIQPWVGNPALLTDQQVKRTGALIIAARALKGVYGVDTHPVYGTPIPAIANKVREVFHKTGGVYESPEAAAKQRREFSKRYRRRKMSKPEYIAYKEKLGRVYPEAARELEEAAAEPIEITYVKVPSADEIRRAAEEVKG